MGNSTSSPAPNPSKEPKENHDIDSSTHKSLRTKKKSLELPDLASLSISTASPPFPRTAPLKTPCIPIPQSNNSNTIYQPQPRTRPQNNFSATDVLITEPSNRPFPPQSRAVAHAALANGSQNQYFRGTQRGHHHPSSNSQRHQPRVDNQRVHDPYHRPNAAPAPPPSLDPNHLHPYSPRHNGFVPEVVHSSMPIGLLKGVTVVENLVPVRIMWRGGGKSVVLARAGDHDWKGRQVMERESGAFPVYSTTVNLPRGTHHFRFLVDDQWRVADDLPTAVDDQGTLANYVAVPLAYSPPKTYSTTPSQPSTAHRLIPGQSFWSATSSADGDMPEPSSRQPHHSSSHYQSVVWTSEIPPELMEAAREEEAYLQASAGQYEANESKGGGTTYVSGFVPAPNIPPAPGLPRHLDKLILNTRMSPAPGGTTPGKASSSGKTKGKDKEKESKRHRDPEKRDKHKPPPAPPPSEDGTGSGLLEPIPSEALSITPVASQGVSANSLPPFSATPDTPMANGVDRDVPASPARSRPIGIDPANTPGLTDDASVLPVPSHVVLHHLCTSAIRNGVLAVANTTRYREKYLTTVYYKPT